MKILPNRLQAPNVKMLYQVAQYLGGELCNSLVFLGGASVGLLLTDSAISEGRSTKDVDVITEVSSLMQYEDLSEKLRMRGFAEDMESGVICRWKFGDLILDVMPTQPERLGFSNRWYPNALQFAESVELNNSTIRLINAPYFLATKIEAFFGRGKGNFIDSHDIEDILLLIDGRTELKEEVKASDPAIQTFIATSLKAFLVDEDFQTAILYYLPSDNSGQKRAIILKKRIEELIIFGS